MVSQHGILLAVSIISDHFGPLVSVSPHPSPSPTPPLPVVPRILAERPHAPARECDALRPSLPIPLSQKVCGCLLRHGALSLHEIVRRLELSPGQARNSLLVLIQHNCVQAFSTPIGKPVCEILSCSI